MTKRKRRRRPGGSGRAPATTSRSRAVPAPLRSPTTVQPPPAGDGETAPVDGREIGTTVHPPAAQSLARGLAVVGRSPSILVPSFLAVVGIWAAFEAYATILAAVPPATMVLFESLPPLRSLLVDVQLLAAGRTVPVAGALALSLAVIGVRAALSATLISLMVEGLDAERGPEADTRVRLRRATARAWRAFPAMFGIETGFLTLALVSLFAAGTFLGASFGQLAVMAALIGGTYFFVYAPVIAVVEGASPTAGVKLAIRTARIPGPRHLIWSVGYIGISLLILQLAPSSRLAHATPSIQVWAYVLFVNFLHLSAQAALVYRWLALRRHVLNSPAEAGPPARRR